MKDILSEIIAHKQTEIELQKQTVSLEQLQEQAGIIIRENAAHRRSMKQALAASSTGIISEFKRRSPSKGWINEAAQAEEIPASYEAAGAGALLPQQVLDPPPWPQRPQRARHHRLLPGERHEAGVWAGAAGRRAGALGRRIAP